MHSNITQKKKKKQQNDLQDEPTIQLQDVPTIVYSVVRLFQLFFVLYSTNMQEKQLEQH